jgi:hypothetical protein
MSNFYDVSADPLKNPENPNAPPEGFFRLLNRDGKGIGLGFHCPHCGVTFFNLSERAGVKHCRKTEYLPSPSFQLSPLPTWNARPIVHRAGATVLMDVNTEDAEPVVWAGSKLPRI